MVETEIVEVTIELPDSVEKLMVDAVMVDVTIELPFSDE